MMIKTNRDAVERIKQFEPLKGSTPELKSRTASLKGRRIRMLRQAVRHPVSISTDDDGRNVRHNDMSPSSDLRGDTIKTYMISMPVDAEEPRVKVGIVKQLNKKDSMADILDHIEDVEKMASNIQIIHVQCSSCVGSFKNIFNKCRIRSKIKATVV